MKLLIVTQRVDREHPVLGFFHRWIQEFAAHCASVTVIAQTVGSYDLPANVRVLSLGKESGVSRARQVASFWHLIAARRSEYDAVFIHMTPIWAVIGWPVWSMYRKPEFLWYEARGARWPLRLALLLVRNVFSASAAGMPLNTKKSVITGHGIDTDVFAPDEAVNREPGFLIHVGRITASKHIPALLDCVAALPHARLLLAGAPVTTQDEAVLAAARDRMDQPDLHGRVDIRSVPPKDIPDLLRKADVFIHASDTSLDKAVLEAMACGCLVVSAAAAFRDILPEPCRAGRDTMAEAVGSMLALPSDQQDALRKTLRRIVEDHHSLRRLIRLLVTRMSPSA
ncbi:MAG TPA: glycosyltransferase [Candidatus Peribacteraceae bacterium]|nr:glycosyltransferase [Candidatus Peribacteraceae bacterium]